MQIQDQDFLEKLIIKSMFEDQGYASLVLSTFESDYFDNESAGEIFLKTKNFFTLEKKLPELGLIPGLVNKPDNVKDFLDSANSIEITLAKSLDVVINESEKFLKKAAVRKAILDSADIVNNDGDYGLIDKNIKQALSKSLKFELGTNYWETLGERLQRMFTDVKRIIPSYYPTLDELISGGFLPRTLSIVAAATHAGKCVSGSTYILIREEHKKIYQVKIGDFISSKLNCKNQSNPLSIDKKKNLFIKKYGNIIGEQKWLEYKKLKKN